MKLNQKSYEGVKSTLPDLQHDLAFGREGNSFEFQHEIVKPFGQLDTVLAWCRSELAGDWRWQLVEVSNDHQPGRYRFYFDSERDCVAFVLRWAN